MAEAQYVYGDCIACGRQVNSLNWSYIDHETCMCASCDDANMLDEEQPEEGE